MVRWDEDESLWVSWEAVGVGMEGITANYKEEEGRYWYPSSVAAGGHYEAEAELEKAHVELQKAEVEI